MVAAETSAEAAAVLRAVWDGGRAGGTSAATWGRLWQEQSVRVYLLF